MYKFKKVLLDVDMDFICSEDRGWWSTPSSRHTKDMHATITGRALGRILRRFKKKGTKIHLIVDHHESLYWWDQLNIRDALCIHIDGHHDMWTDGLPNKVEVGYRAGVDCGSYLNQAIRDQIVNKVIYVPAQYRRVTDERTDVLMNLNMDFPYRTARGKAKVLSWKQFKKTVHEYPKADIITIAISPEWMPRHLWPEIEAFCTHMRIHPNIIKAKRRMANRKWNQLAKYDDCSSFSFPYSRRR